MNCSTIRDVLDLFCGKSIQSVSEAKTRVFFSPNIDNDTRESLYDVIPIYSLFREILGHSHQALRGLQPRFQLCSRLGQAKASWVESKFVVLGW